MSVFRLSFLSVREQTDQSGGVSVDPQLSHLSAFRSRLPPTGVFSKQQSHLWMVCFKEHVYILTKFPFGFKLFSSMNLFLDNPAVVSVCLYAFHYVCVCVSVEHFSCSFAALQKVHNQHIN